MLNNFRFFNVMVKSLKRVVRAFKNLADSKGFIRNVEDVWAGGKIMRYPRRP